MTLLRWAIGYSNEAKTHILSWAVQAHIPGAKTTPSLCGCDLPFGWLPFFEQQPDPHDFPPCRVCLARDRWRRSALAPRTGALRAPASRPRQEEDHPAQAVGGGVRG